MKERRGNLGGGGGCGGGCGVRGIGWGWWIEGVGA